MNFLSRLKDFLFGESAHIDPLRDPGIRDLTERVGKVEELTQRNVQITREIIASRVGVEDEKWWNNRNAS